MSIRIGSILNFRKVSATPSEAAASTDLHLYGKSDDALYTKNSAGGEKQIQAVTFVRVSTTAEFALTGLPASTGTDGVTVANGDRVLVRHQGVGQPGSGNGVYVVNSAGAWSRATDADTSAEIAGMWVVPTEGSKFRGVVFRSNFKSTDTLGTTAMNWAHTSSQIDHGATYPNPVVGHIFLDTSGTVPTLKFNAGASWAYVYVPPLLDIVNNTASNTTAVGTWVNETANGLSGSFTAPASGKVKITIGALLSTNAAGIREEWGFAWSGGTTRSPLDSEVLAIYAGSSSSLLQASHTYTVSGLTSGTTYTLTSQIRSQTGASASMGVGSRHLMVEVS